MTIKDYRALLTTSVACQAYSYVLLFIALRAYKKRNAQYHKMADMAQYLVSMLEEHNVTVTEFDVIALTDLGLKLKIVEEES